MIIELVTNNWITVAIIFILFLIAVLKYFAPKQFADFMSLTKSNEYFVDYIEKSATFLTKFNSILLLIQTNIFALLFVKVNEHILKNNIENEFLLFLKVNGVIIGYYFFRNLIGILLSKVLSLEESQNSLTYIKHSYLSKTSILILPMLIFALYTISFKVIFIQIVLGFTLVLLLAKYAQILIKNQKLIFSNLFYFILYLCALEIAPLIFLYKLFIDKV